jgi:hypothetical protein
MPLTPSIAPCSILTLSPERLRQFEIGTLLQITGLPDPSHLVSSHTQSSGKPALCQFIPHPDGILVRHGEHLFLNGGNNPFRANGTHSLMKIHYQEDGIWADINGYQIKREGPTICVPHYNGALIVVHDDDIVRVRLLLLKHGSIERPKTLVLPSDPEFMLEGGT